MLAGLKRRLTRKHVDKEGDDDDKDDIHTFPPPANYIKISQGKIHLVHQTRSLEHTDTAIQDVQEKQDKEILESRIVELEGALLQLQEQFKNNQCGSPTFEKELREQLENMNRVIKSKERKQIQTCREHKVLQSRFARQENLLQTMQQENRALLLRIRQYEHCLDDVMRKVVDAIVAEDNLREEVAMLKSRVKDLEAQNAALSASPAKGRDEGYCTMSSGQPQPSNGHLEDLPEEPEQWLLPGEPCSTEMEDWSMSQEELAVITLEDERDHHQMHSQNQEQLRAKFNNGEHDWLWNTNELLASTMAETDSIAESITQLLQQKIVYSEDEEITCTDFTNDFYKLVNIRSNSAHSLYSYIEGDTDEEDDDDDDEDEDDEDEDTSLSAVHLKSLKQKICSPTPSEAGQAQLTSCSSSETDDLSSSHCTTTATTHTQTPTTHRELPPENDYEIIDEVLTRNTPTHPNPNANNEVDVDENINPHPIEENPFIFPNPRQNQEETQLHLEDIPKDLNETECITEIIKNELRKPLAVRPPHLLVKSHSMIEEEEPSCILRNNQRREIESSVVRSGSVNCSISSAITMSSTSSSTSSSPSKISKLPNRNRFQYIGHHNQSPMHQRPMNSWRRSNGWKRVTSPAQSPVPLNVSPKKDIKKESAKSLNQKLIPTKIPTCLPTNSSNQPLQSQRSISPKQHQNSIHQIKKSKIPPPVPIRRSYAS